MRYRGKGSGKGRREYCQSFFFSRHPNFKNTGLLVFFFFYRQICPRAFVCDVFSILQNIQSLNLSFSSRVIASPFFSPLIGSFLISRNSPFSTADKAISAPLKLGSNRNPVCNGIHLCKAVGGNLDLFTRPLCWQ